MRMDKLTTTFQTALADAQSLAVGRDRHRYADAFAARRARGPQERARRPRSRTDSTGSGRVHAHELALARREWYPEQTLFKRGFAMFNTVFEDMTVNSYLVWDAKTKLADSPVIIYNAPGNDDPAAVDEAAAAGATLLVATHELAFVSRVGRLLALRDGAVVYDGPPADADVHALVLPS